MITRWSTSSCRINTTVRSIPSDPRTQTTVPACQADHFDHSIARKTLILKSLCQSFVLCRAMTGLFRPPHPPRAPRGMAMGHVVYKPLLGAQTPTTHLALTNGSCLAMFNSCSSSESGSEVFQMPCPTVMHASHHNHHGRPEGKMINF